MLSRVLIHVSMECNLIFLNKKDICFNEQHNTLDFVCNSAFHSQGIALLVKCAAVVTVKNEEQLLDKHAGFVNRKSNNSSMCGLGIHYY